MALVTDSGFAPGPSRVAHRKLLLLLFSFFK